MFRTRALIILIKSWRVSIRPPSSAYITRSVVSTVHCSLTFNRFCILFRVFVSDFIPTRERTHKAGIIERVNQRWRKQYGHTGVVRKCYNSSANLMDTFDCKLQHAALCDYPDIPCTRAKHTRLLSSD